MGGDIREVKKVEAVILLVVAMAVFGFAAARWGTNSIERFDSPEWEKRHNWRGFANS
jgi:hypothetical protein